MDRRLDPGHRREAFHEASDPAPLPMGDDVVEADLMRETRVVDRFDRVRRERTRESLQLGFVGRVHAEPLLEPSPERVRLHVPLAAQPEPRQGDRVRVIDLAPAVDMEDRMLEVRHRPSLSERPPRVGPRTLRAREGVIGEAGDEPREVRAKSCPNCG